MRTLYENIVDSDEKIKNDFLKDVAREWMKYAAKSYQNECEEGKDYSIDDDGKIQVYGNCTSLLITDLQNTLKKLNPYVKIITLEPKTTCKITVIDADAAASILPIQLGNSRYVGTTLIYQTKQNLEPRHFPTLVNGNIKISEAGNVNLSIIPNCTSEFYINTRKCGTIKWPAGFPTDVKKIEIAK